ncbi:tRNA(Ile)-lysidine synthase [Bosea thiooxidans]
MSETLQPDPVSKPVSSVEAGLLFEGLSPEARLLAAVSGGPDSIALLGLLAEWAKGPGRPAIHAATVDHGLRPEAAAEAEDVAALCRRLGVPHRTLRWEGAKPASGVQAEARRARYALLAAEARRLGGAALVTAHTLDDQAETVLMRLAHGSGPSGLGGMRARAERDGLVLARPLLGIAKARLVATAQARGLPFIRDPSNADERFERVRWRAAMPLLAQRGLTAERLGRLAERMARLDAVADRRAGEAFAGLRLPDDHEGEGEEVRLDFPGSRRSRRRSCCACWRWRWRRWRRPVTAMAGWSGWRTACTPCSRRNAPASPRGGHCPGALWRSPVTECCRCAGRARGGAAFTLRHRSAAATCVSLGKGLRRT